MGVYRYRFCLVTGPPILFVVAKDADAIRELLEDADEGSGSSGGTLVAVILVLLFVNVEVCDVFKIDIAPLLVTVPEAVGTRAFHSRALPRRAPLRKRSCRGGSS